MKTEISTVFLEEKLGQWYERIIRQSLDALTNVYFVWDKIAGPPYRANRNHMINTHMWTACKYSLSMAFLQTISEMVLGSVLSNFYTMSQQERVLGILLS